MRMMGQNQNKKIAKNSLILYFRLIVTSVIGLIATRIVFKNLGASDYGLYSVVGSVVVMMNFLNTAMVTTTYRFIAFEMGKSNEGNINKVFNISLSIHLFLAVLVVILAETAGIWYINTKLNVEPNRLTDAIFVFRLSILASVFNIISMPYRGFVTAIEKFSVRASIEILRTVVRLLLVLLLGFMVGDKLRIYAIMMAFVSFTPSAFFVFYCRKYHHRFVKWKFDWDKEKYKEMFWFSNWTIIGAVASLGKSTGSQLILNFFFGTLLNAAFGVANQLNSFVVMFSQNLGQAAVPQITKSHSGGNNKRTLDLVAYISKYTFILMLIPSLPILLETEFLVKIWIGEIPEYTIAFCRLMVVNGLISSLMGGVPAAINASGKVKWFHIVLSSISLSTLPIAYTLFKFGLPPYIIQIVYIITTILATTTSLILLKKVINYNVSYLLKVSYLNALYIIITISPLFFVIRAFPASNYRFILGSLSILLWGLFMIYLVGLDQNEKAKFKTLLKKMRKV